MAISTPTTLTSGGDTANAGTYTTAAVTLTANRLYLFVANGYRSGGGTIINSITHDASGTPLSFTLVSAGGTDARVQPWDTAAHRTLAVWYVIPSTTTANAAITVVWQATQSAMGWRVVEITGGFDSADPFVQVQTNTGTTSAITVTMSSFSGTDNLTFLAMGWGSGTSNPSQTVAPTESRVELGEHADGERGRQGVHYQNPNGSDTSIGATLSSNNDWGAIGIELRASGAATTDDVLIRFGSLSVTTGSGLVTTDFTATGVAVTASGMLMKYWADQVQEV